MADSLGHKAAQGALWASVNRFGSMAIQFVVNLIMARLLMPEDFGAIGLLYIFIAVSQTLIDGGFCTALIQKKEPTQTDYSTIFFWNLAFSTLLYTVLFLAAPLIAEYYRMPHLCKIMRILGTILIINSFSIIQQNRLTKHLAFKTLAIVQLSAYSLAAVCAITAAFYGWGVWSLVALQLIQSALSAVLFWSIAKWRPTLEFSLLSFKSLFSFGGYLLIANILQNICQNVQGLIIGRKFSAAQMGYYSQAQKLDSITSYSIPQVIVSVMFPVYSSIQDDRERLISVLSMNMRVISFLIFPLMAFLAIIAEPLLSGLYGDKWLPAVPYFQIFCVGGIFVCLQNINYYAVAAVGQSRSLFAWSFYKWGMMLILLLIGSFWGMYGILWAMVINQINLFGVNAYLASHFVGFSLRSQSTIILRSLILVALCAIPSILILLLTSWHPFISGATFFFTYLAVSFIVKPQALSETRHLISKILKRSK